jgi:hypothetical protein
VNFVLWEGIYPLGVKFSVRTSILLNSRECSPLGVIEGVKIPPWGQISPLGARGEVKNGPLNGPGLKNVFLKVCRQLFNVCEVCNALVAWSSGTVSDIGVKLPIEQVKA